MAIAAMGLTATLTFWNMFSTPQKQQVLVQATDTSLPPPQDPTQAPTVPPPALGGPAFIPVKIIFGGVAPLQQQTVVQQAAAPQAGVAQPRHKGGGAPRPAASTGSSKP